MMNAIARLLTPISVFAVAFSAQALAQDEEVITIDINAVETHVVRVVEAAVLI